MHQLASHLFVACCCDFVEVYHLIEFTKSQTVAVISSNWMIGTDKCFYPVGYSDGKVIAAAKKHQKPNDEWEMFNLKVVVTKGLLF